MTNFNRRDLLVLLAFGLALKTLLYAWAWYLTGATPLLLVQGHDGAEYLDYARILATAHSGQLPADIARHDPGLSAILALLWSAALKSLDLPVIALLLQTFSWIIGSLLIARIIQLVIKTAPMPILLASTLGYPAALYYGQFNLSEPLFMVLIFSAILASLSHRFIAAALLTGLASTVRSTGLLLLGSIFLTHPVIIQYFKAPGQPAPKPAVPRIILIVAVGLLPWIIAQVSINYTYYTNVSTYKPAFGLPFSGFQGLAQAGIARSIYMIGTVFFFILSTGMLVRQTLKYTSIPPLITVFVTVFLVFHLCLKTLYYIDTTVYTFDYQDRYLAPIWPLALLAWHRYIRRSAAAALILISTVFAAWWLKNYIAVSGLLT